MRRVEMRYQNTQKWKNTHYRYVSSNPEYNGEKMISGTSQKAHLVNYFNE